MLIILDMSFRILDGYKFEPAQDFIHKYKVEVYDKESKKNKYVYFGSINYQQYKDKIGMYKYLDHNDNKRRKLFRDRFERFKNKKETAGWFAYYYLW